VKILHENTIQLYLAMNIFHVITTIEIGGAENQLLLLAQEQISIGNQLTIVPLKGNATLKKDFEKIGAKIDVSLLNHNFLIQIWRLRKRILSEFASNTILHAHLPQAELVLRFAAPKEYAIVNTRHFGGDFYPGKKRFLSAILGRIASKKASRIIGISNAVVDILHRNHEVYNSEKITRIYYGFGSTRFELTNEKFVVKKSNQIVIGTIARLSPEKDLATLLKAFSQFRKHEGNASLQIIGEGPDSKYLKEMAKSLGLEKSINWLGKQREVLTYLNNFDIFVLTSKFEGFGMVLLEAMYASKRIVCARNSAIIEVVGEGNAGLYFETSNSEDLFQKLKESLEIDIDFIKVDQLKRLKLFNIEECARQHQMLYKTILSERSIG
jgi:glycosyltransferase involved in cell wall biosynthesis